MPEDQVSRFFEIALSEGAQAGLIGAIVISVGSRFQPVGVTFKAWPDALAFIAVGWLVAAAYYHFETNEPHYIACFVLGAFWLHLPLLLKDMLSVWLQAKSGIPTGGPTSDDVGGNPE